jgi:hypothetical protein
MNKLKEMFERADDVTPPKNSMHQLLVSPR